MRLPRAHRTYLIQFISLDLQRCVNCRRRLNCLVHLLSNVLIAALTHLAYPILDQIIIPDAAIPAGGPRGTNPQTPTNCLSFRRKSYISTNLRWAISQKFWVALSWGRTRIPGRRGRISLAGSQCWYRHNSLFAPLHGHTKRSRPRLSIMRYSGVCRITWRAEFISIISTILETGKSTALQVSILRLPTGMSPSSDIM